MNAFEFQALNHSRNSKIPLQYHTHTHPTKPNHFFFFWIFPSWADNFQAHQRPQINRIEARLKPLRLALLIHKMMHFHISNSRPVIKLEQSQPVDDPIVQVSQISFHDHHTRTKNLNKGI